ncbi:MULTISPECIES: MaoC family dehydratase [unclassified Spirosoma]|uniref:MaoC family dehydratase n=1 Tax=unclassified Spirosoma TaxID=2621999 RepID=UPI00095B07F9|nr:MULTISPECIES: MaoC family dehydratase [unclassified Spirosoma]MBN8824072.1 MaoC family dehydratase [Spirosoma sp.]OJW70470.1 MAG: dehydratase [Spirosoma sp. 48-14]
MLTVRNLTELAALAGQSLGSTDYLSITQQMVDRFAEATGDYQWIHTDPERAATESPYKTTIAHGFLTLSLAPQLMAQIYRVESVRMGINYGANKIRFTNAVPVGSRLRLNARLLSVEPQATGSRVITECIFEIENRPKPACVAELITLLFE